MIRVGLTGNIGSGKSTVADVFSSLGIPVYKADEESKKLLRRHDVIKLIEESFGQEVVSEGTIDRNVLASVVFGNGEALGRLNRLLHPLVMAEFNNWIVMNAGATYVIMEAAILFESGYAKDFDRIIHVSCPQEKSVERVIKRDGLSREQVLGRLKHQMKNDDKALRSDFIINNDGSQMIIPQVMTIHKKLLNICR
jgi:dephospho-CoA kinase